MTEQKLRRCPFCGGEAILDDHADECMGIYTVFCSECGAMLDFFDTEAEAIEAWNKRVSCDTCSLYSRDDGCMASLVEDEVAECKLN